MTFIISGSVAGDIKGSEAMAPFTTKPNPNTADIIWHKSEDKRGLRAAMGYLPQGKQAICN